MLQKYNNNRILSTREKSFKDKPNIWKKIVDHNFINANTKCILMLMGTLLFEQMTQVGTFAWIYV